MRKYKNDKLTNARPIFLTVIAIIWLISLLTETVDARRGRVSETRPDTRTETRSERSEVYESTGQTRSTIIRQESGRAYFSYPKSPRFQDKEQLFDAPNYAGVRVDAEFFRHRLEELAVELSGSPLLINLAGKGEFISNKIQKLRREGELTLEVISMEPNVNRLTELVEATPHDRPIVVLAHVIGDGTKLSNLSETAGVEWASVKGLFTSKKRVSILMGCRSACMRDAATGIQGKFDELSAIDALKKFSAAQSIGDLYSIIGQTAEGFVLRSTAAGYEGRATNKEGDGVWVNVVNPASSDQLSSYETNVQSLTCGSSRSASTTPCMVNACWRAEETLESVQERWYRANLRTISLIIAVMMNVFAVLAYRSKSLAKRRLMPSHANVLSTIQRLGRTSKPAWLRFMISMGRGLELRTLGPW